MARREDDPRPAANIELGARSFLVAFLAATIFAFFARTFVVEGFRIPTGSMEKGLLAGDHILVNKFIYGGLRTGGRRDRLLLPVRDVRRGDVVVFRHPRDPGRDLVKRCLGLPGETLAIDGRGLRIDGALIDESGYAVDAPASGRETFGPYTVPAGRYFCLGDHRERSRDSRSWGPVAASHLKGRAVMIYWSIGAADRAAENRDIWDKIGRSLGRGLAHIRWQRSFTLVR